MKTETPSPAPIVVPLNHLTRVCGYFNYDTVCNNGYGCDHPDCEDSELVRVTPSGDVRKYGLEYQIKIAAMRKAFGSIADIQKALETQDGKDYYEGLDRLMYDHSFVARFGCKRQGICMSYTCPVAFQADLEDLKTYDQDLYEEWKDEDSEPHEVGADLMVVSDPSLISQLQ